MIFKNENDDVNGRRVSIDMLGWSVLRKAGSIQFVDDRDPFNI